MKILMPLDYLSNQYIGLSETAPRIIYDGESLMVHCDICEKIHLESHEEPIKDNVIPFRRSSD